MGARHWSEERIRRELEAFLPSHDTFPTYTHFRTSGRRGLWQATQHHGGPARFADDYGLPVARQPRGLTETEIRAELRALLRATNLTAWPSRSWLIKHGGPNLTYAVECTGGADRWAAELNLPLRHHHGQHWTPQTTNAALEQFLAGRRTWPNRREFEAAGVAGLYAAITKTVGHATMASRYGLPLQRPGRRRTAPKRQTTQIST